MEACVAGSLRGGLASTSARVAARAAPARAVRVLAAASEPRKQRKSVKPTSSFAKSDGMKLQPRIKVVYSYREETEDSVSGSWEEVGVEKTLDLKSSMPTADHYSREQPDAQQLSKQMRIWSMMHGGGAVLTEKVNKATRTLTYVVKRKLRKTKGGSSDSVSDSETT